MIMKKCQQRKLYKIVYKTDGLVELVEMRYKQMGRLFKQQKVSMTDLRCYVLFDSISGISGRWVGDDERLSALELPFTTEKISASSGARTRDR